MPTLDEIPKCLISPSYIFGLIVWESAYGPPGGIYRASYHSQLSTPWISISRTILTTLRHQYRLRMSCPTPSRSVFTGQHFPCSNSDETFASRTGTRLPSYRSHWTRPPKIGRQEQFLFGRFWSRNLREHVYTSAEHCRLIDLNTVPHLSQCAIHRMRCVTPRELSHPYIQHRIRNWGNESTNTFKEIHSQSGVFETFSGLPVVLRNNPGVYQNKSLTESFTLLA